MSGSVEAAGELPFFVYGTLRPGERNYDLCLRGRTAREEPARLERALLYDGPGYPYAVESSGTADVPGSAEALGAVVVTGAVAGDLITAKRGEYGELLAVLDELEEYVAPGDPANVYERVARAVLTADDTTVRAWVYVAAPRVAHELRARGRPIAGGDWRVHVGPYPAAHVSPPPSPPRPAGQRP